MVTRLRVRSVHGRDIQVMRQVSGGCAVKKGLGSWSRWARSQSCTYICMGKGGAIEEMPTRAGPGLYPLSPMQLGSSEDHRAHDR